MKLTTAPDPTWANAFLGDFNIPVDHPYFQPDALQLEGIAEAVQGKVVADLGCGTSGIAARVLTTIGAAKILAVDNLPLKKVQPLPSTVTYVQADFAQGWVPPERCDVAFVSWPEAGKELRWENILPHFPVIVYLGKNLAGTVRCGNHKFWTHLSRRDLIDARYSESGGNNLLIYGPMTDKRHKPRCIEEGMGRAIHPVTSAMTYTWAARQIGLYRW